MSRWAGMNKPAPGTEDWLNEIFTYHPPTSEIQKRAYENVRYAAKEFARVVATHTPSCADQSVALRKIREAVMVANASIALEGLV